MDKYQKLEELEKFAKKLFLEYKPRFNNKSYQVMLDWDDEILNKAEELGFDLDYIYIDGEAIDFESEEEYKNSTKEMWIEYNDEIIFSQSWK